METSDSKDKDVNKRTYGKIVLTLENAILSSEKLEGISVSQEDGLTRETELDLRILGCELIQTAGILLKLPQVSDLKRVLMILILHARHIAKISTHDVKKTT